jgi:hypothetical protein
MQETICVRDVFKPLGVPTTTYVRRENGKYESELSNALDTKGELCLLTGPSKTGKTTLYTRVLHDKGLEPIVVRCDVSMSAEDLWRSSLERIDFKRLNAIQSSASTKASGAGRIAGTIGWKWLADILGEVSVGVERGMGEIQVRERILAKPSPDHLIPILRHLPAILIVEDFHYLEETAKQTVFQQWKVFVDGEVPVIIVGTMHHAVDLAYANKDLIGRIAHLDLSIWNVADLEKIAIQGFEALKLDVPRLITSTIASEAAGLPILVQDTCAQLLKDKGIETIRPGKSNIKIERSDVYAALHAVAKTHYGQFEGLYGRLITGPRKTARKYNTYELVLSTFTKDPLVFSLERYEIDERLQSMPMPESQRPPGSSVNATLGALAKFQKRNDINLLEWSEKMQRLYIVEPAFLFYLRWREKRNAPPTTKGLWESLLGILQPKPH